jgi:uncharacterized DUF497 family protein
LINGLTDNEDVKYCACDIFFTWDDAKNRENMKKHDGITFNMAAEVFCDPNVVYLEPYRRTREIRWDVIGRPSPDTKALLFVVATERIARDGADVVRIISARRADRREEEIYYVEQGID